MSGLDANGFVDFETRMEMLDLLDDDGTLVEVVELQAGGRWVFTRFADGSFQIAVETDAVSLRVPLMSEEDMHGVVHACVGVLGGGV